MVPTMPGPHLALAGCGEGAAPTVPRFDLGDGAAGDMGVEPVAVHGVRPMRV
jgi:hypothetical protein